MNFALNAQKGRFEGGVTWKKEVEGKWMTLTKMTTLRILIQKKFEKKGRRAKMQKKPHSEEVKGENKS